MKSQISHPGKRVGSCTRKILVVANEIVEGHRLREAIGLQVGEESCAEVRVTAPALMSRLRYWLSDGDEARRSAALRLAAELESLRAAGIEADGQVGDPDPLLAIADALFHFEAEKIVIATRPQGRLHWLTRDLVDRVQRRFAQRVEHVVLEPGDEWQTGTARSPAALKTSAYRRVGPLDRTRVQANG
jgi:hypothetical protein